MSYHRNPTCTQRMHANSMQNLSTRHAKTVFATQDENFFFLKLNAMEGPVKTVGKVLCKHKDISAIPRTQVTKSWAWWHVLVNLALRR